ncbi:hypothetical protein TWF970_001281 [Orbilia oligospora]|uniref:Uncharacterized protein n=1 Tax=Orbilia oligospora TaxID=2813651 RepID=A0A7C8VIJ9_ORBOL|nr:hypothetical protein TWF970_001281 [Orbilia oligospora]
MDPEKDPGYALCSSSGDIMNKMLPRFNAATRHTSCPNSLDCYNGHYYLITTDHLSGARFPDDKDYHHLHQTYITTQIRRKAIWLVFTIVSFYALYSIHFTSISESPCRPSLHDFTESPTYNDRDPLLILELRWQDFCWCMAMIGSILSSTAILWRADAVFEDAVEMRQRRKIHGLPVWPPEINDKKLKLKIESWGVNFGCFLLTIGITLVWCWSVWKKVEAERGCRILLN